MEGQSSWLASTTGRTASGDRSDRYKRPVWPPRATGQTGWGFSITESRIGNARFGSLRWRNTASILGTRQWGASGSWGYTKRAAIWSSTTFKCSGGKILANDNLPHEVSMQQISLQGALKTLIKYLRSWAGWKLQHQRIKAELEVFQFELENWQTICNKAYWCSYFYSSVKEWNQIYLGGRTARGFWKDQVLFVFNTCAQSA